MRPPITYALITLLVGLPTCALGHIEKETYAGICAMVVGLCWVKLKEKYDLVRKTIGVVLGIVFIFACCRDRNKEERTCAKKHDSNLWSMMPPRELDLSLKVIEIRKFLANNIKYGMYVGCVIEAPVIRKDLIGKKVCWIQKTEKGAKKLFQDDIVFLNGVIKNQNTHKIYDEKRNIRYFLENIIILNIDHDESIMALIKRKLHICLTEEKTKRYPGFVYALLLGDREMLDNKQSLLFKETGTMHLFAVSGLHIGIMYIITSFALRRACGERSVWILGSLILVFGYVGLVGFTDSACRAFVMVGIWKITLLLNKKTNALSSLYWSAIILLLLKPESFFSLGFQLSFTVVLNILFCFGKMNSETDEVRQVNFLKSSILVSSSSFMGSSLLIIDYFHYINPIAIILNVFLVNIIVVVFFFCLMYVLLKILFDSNLLSFFIEHTYNALELFLEFFHKMKYFQFRFSEDFDIPNVIHLIYPLILISVQPYLFRLWHRILILTSLPALFLLFSICVN